MRTLQKAEIIGSLKQTKEAVAAYRETIQDITYEDLNPDTMTKLQEMLSELYLKIHSTNVVFNSFFE